MASERSVIMFGTMENAYRRQLLNRSCRLAEFKAYIEAFDFSATELNRHHDPATNDYVYNVLCVSFFNRTKNNEPMTRTIVNKIFADIEERLGLKIGSAEFEFDAFTVGGMLERFNFQFEACLEELKNMAIRVPSFRQSPNKIQRLTSKPKRSLKNG